MGKLWTFLLVLAVFSSGFAVDLSSVKLTARPILPNRYDSAWEVRVSDKVKTELFAPDGKKIGEFAADSFSVIAPQLWSEGNPVLYRVVFRDGDDQVERTFGFRTWERTSDSLLLNGCPVRIKARTLKNAAEITESPDDEEAVAECFAALRKANANAVLGSIAAMRSSFLDACDREGVYVVDFDNCRGYGAGHACVVPVDGLERDEVVVNGSWFANADFAATAEKYFGVLKLAKLNPFAEVTGVRCDWTAFCDGEKLAAGRIPLTGLATNSALLVDMPYELLFAWGRGGAVKAVCEFRRGGWFGFGGEKIAESEIVFPVTHLNVSKE